MDRVSCYSGSTYAERPVRFSWNDQEHSVTKIISTALHPEGKDFTVENDAGETFLLLYNFSKNEWTITPI